jgi:DNA mismatch repair protein MutL
MQHFFINGRYVKTRTAMAALEQAYKGSIMTGKFPSCVLHMDMPFETVDANVHPAKIEVRFAMEKPVFDAVYHGVVSALEKGDTRKQMSIPAKVPVGASAPMNDPKPEQLHMQTSVKADTAFTTARTIATLVNANAHTQSDIDETPMRSANASTSACAGKASFSKRTWSDKPFSAFGSSMLRDAGESRYGHSTVSIDIERTTASPPTAEMLTPTAEVYANSSKQQDDFENPRIIDQPDEVPAQMDDSEHMVTYLGEAFNTYILAEMNQTLYFIDKHAAHERILYNQLKTTKHNCCYLLFRFLSAVKNMPPSWASRKPYRGQDLMWRISAAARC